MTKGGSLLSIPNSVVLDSAIDNYSLPTDVYQLDFLVETVPGYSPTRVTSLIERAVLSAECVLKDPEPVILFGGREIPLRSIL